MLKQIADMLSVLMTVTAVMEHKLSSLPLLPQYKKHMLAQQRDHKRLQLYNKKLDRHVLVQKQELEVEKNNFSGR